MPFRFETYCCAFPSAAHQSSTVCAHKLPHMNRISGVCKSSIVNCRERIFRREWSVLSMPSMHTRDTWTTFGRSKSPPLVLPCCLCMQPGWASGGVHLLAPSLHKLDSSDIATHPVLVAGVCVHARRSDCRTKWWRERTNSSWHHSKSGAACTCRHLDFDLFSHSHLLLSTRHFARRLDLC